jgi:hypothetical protein
MVEMRPGIDIDRFVAGFIRESKTKIHPWVSEYDRSAKPEPDQEKEAERHMLAALREVAKTELTVHYEPDGGGSISRHREIGVALLCRQEV